MLQDQVDNYQLISKVVSIRTQTCMLQGQIDCEVMLSSSQIGPILGEGRDGKGGEGY